jgi:hypothetical protein
MKPERFSEVLDSRIEKIRTTLDSKSKEYSTAGDKLYNFVRAAEMSRTTVQSALWGMFAKHLVSVADLVEGSLTASPAMVNEKIGDAINYLILLEAVFTEQQDARDEIEKLMQEESYTFTFTGEIDARSSSRKQPAKKSTGKKRRRV